MEPGCRDGLRSLCHEMSKQPVENGMPAVDWPGVAKRAWFVMQEGTPRSSPDDALTHYATWPKVPSRSLHSR